MGGERGGGIKVGISNETKGVEGYILEWGGGW